jgi:uncharacterized protein YoxC
VSFVALALLLAMVYLDYRWTKSALQEARSSVAVLEQQVQDGQRQSKLLVARIEENAKAQDLQRQKVEALAIEQEATRRQVQTVISGLRADEVAQVIQENPDEAPAIVMSRTNDLFRLFDDATEN